MNVNEQGGLGWKWDEDAKRLDLLFEESDKSGVIRGLKTSLDGLPEMPPKQNIDKTVAKFAIGGFSELPARHSYKPVTWQEYLDAGWDNNEEDTE